MKEIWFSYNLNFITSNHRKNCQFCGLQRIPAGRPVQFKITYMEFCFYFSYRFLNNLHSSVHWTPPVSMWKAVILQSCWNLTSLKNIFVFRHFCHQWPFLDTNLEHVSKCHFTKGNVRDSATTVFWVQRETVKPWIPLPQFPSPTPITIKGSDH